MPDHTIFNERPESQNRALKVLEKLGYTTVSRSDAEKKRASRRAVLFEDELEAFLSKRTYPYGYEERYFSGGSIAAAIRAIDVQSTKGLYATNKEIYNLICSGKSLEEALPDSTKQSFDIPYIDFKHPENNIYQVTDEFEVERPNGKFARPDIVILINGIPVVVIECKKSSVDVMEGVKQNIRNWGNNYIPQLFQYTQIVMAVNPDKVLSGTCGTERKQFVSWHEEDSVWLNEWCKKCSPDGQYKEQDRALISLLHPERLLELIYNFIIYDNGIKKIARYKQYFAVKKCMARITQKDDAQTRNGVIWHTQGTGKTIIMIMLTKLIIRELSSISPRFIMVTDRINLDKQVRDNFINTKMSPHRAKTGKGLIDLLDDEGNTVITALVNKFESAIKLNYRNESDNIFLFIDEGHRTQYGKLNTYMRNVLPNAVKLAFTGTPLLSKPKSDKKEAIETAKNTYLKFGPLVDRYRLQDAIDDGVTVPIVYEGRVIPQKVTSEQIDAHLKYITIGLTEDEKEDLKKKYSRFVAISQTDQRLRMVAYDLFSHFVSYVKPKGFKAMLTCSSRAAAVEIFYLLKSLDGINPAVVITPNTHKEGADEINTLASDKVIADFFKAEVDPLYRNDYEKYEDMVISNFISDEGDIDLLIVKDKLLTGFDAPIAGVLYVDKPLQDHTLLQAIARVNRVYENKDFGLIVDYNGIFKKLNSALDLYSDELSGMNGFESVDIENAISAVSEVQTKLSELHQTLWGIFCDIDKEERVENIWQERLRDYGVRQDFYTKLASFAKLVDFLYSSYNLFEAIGYDKSEEYRRDFLFFKKLKDSVSLRYNDRVDFSKYEDGIRQLLNTYVNAEDAKIIIEPLDILNKDKREEQLARLGSKEAKAEAIQTRQVEILESKKYDDPILYMTFMERINKSINDYMEERDSEKYLSDMERIADDYSTGMSSVEYPEVIMHDSTAKTFYGAVNSGIKKSTGDTPGGTLYESLGDLSMQVKEKVGEYAKRDWRDNVVVHRNIKKHLDDLLYDYMEKHNLDWTPNTIDIVIDEIMMSARKVF